MKSNDFIFLCLQNRKSLQQIAFEAKFKDKLIGKASLGMYFCFKVLPMFVTENLQFILKRKVDIFVISGEIFQCSNCYNKCMLTRFLEFCAITGYINCDLSRII